MAQDVDHARYSPEQLDRIIHGLEYRRSRAESLGQSRPDAHRRAKGKRADPYRNADELVDLERALVFGLPRHGVEYLTVDYRMKGHNLGAIAEALHLEYQAVAAAYDRALTLMARFLGWSPPTAEREPGTAPSPALVDLMLRERRAYTDYPELLRDLDNAVCTFPVDSLEALVVRFVRRGYSINEARKQARCRSERAHSAYQTACATIAERMGWIEEG